MGWWRRIIGPRAGSDSRAATSPLRKGSDSSASAVARGPGRLSRAGEFARKMFADAQDSPLLVTESPFSAVDDWGNLHCKGCGLAYRSWNVRELKPETPFASTCLACEKISVFDPEEVFGGVYFQTVRPGLPGPGASLENLSTDSSGHLLCRHCRAPLAYTHHGGLTRLENNGLDVLFLACAACRAISRFELGELHKPIGSQRPVR